MATISKTDCVLHQGTVMNKGYGVVYEGGERSLAHRSAWEAENGPIPDGFILHHACEVKLCVNVEHLELMTQADHNRLHQTGVFRAVCKRGHDVANDANVFGPRRKCRQCHALRTRNWRARQLEAA